MLTLYWRSVQGLLARGWSFWNEAEWAGGCLMKHQRLTQLDSYWQLYGGSAQWTYRVFCSTVRPLCGKRLSAQGDFGQRHCCTNCNRIADEYSDKKIEKIRLHSTILSEPLRLLNAQCRHAHLRPKENCFILNESHWKLSTWIQPQVYLIDQMN